jgi:TnpA family transposase
MPRMRGLSDAAFYRPDKTIRYEHIDALFKEEINWDLIATHAHDMIQVALSIQAGRVMPSMLLRKLSSYNRKSLLYRAFRELGRVERTLFLLRYISNTEVRRVIRAETTKIEAYNDFLDWVCFGGAGLTTDTVLYWSQAKGQRIRVSTRRATDTKWGATDSATL